MKGKKGNINEMQALVAPLGGKCLSNIYVNSKTKLKWQCSKGHKWEARPEHVKRGHWCPYCALRGRRSWQPSIPL